jgi:filamentous hemagglutinin family protein
MKRKIIFVATASLFAEGLLAQALPTGGTLTRGAGSIDTAGSAMTVTQTSQRAIFDFTTYNIGAGASVTYAQPGASAVAVSRVPLSAGRSQIDGTLSANGHVMLLNPNGVLFGSSAVVNVGSLTASTGTINDDAFMAAATSIAIAGATTGSIENRGTITASSAGLVAFVAPSVVNSGVITALGGRIVLGGAQAATISFNGGLYELAVGEGVAGSSVTNSGTLRTATTTTGAVPSGTIVLSAPEVDNVVSGAINLSGIQRANRVEVHGGVVTLSSDLDASAVAGTSGAARVSAGAQIQDAVDVVRAGATIDVYGGTYAEGHANVDYFGAAGGGQNFGLHVYKDDLTIRGRKASGAALSGLDDAEMPVVTAKYQTGFGAQHFVSGSGVTIDGLKFKPVSTGTNKTLEVIGDDFTLKNSVIDNSGNATAAAFYISDFALPGRPQVESFRLENNRFIAGTTASALVVVASGAGNSTAASNRVFRNNQLIGNPALTGARGFQVQGLIDGIAWQPFTAGAVTLENNTFSGFDAPVRSVGVLSQELDWNSIFSGNTFVGGAALAFVGDTTTARAGTAVVSGATENPVDTRITRTIQASIDRAQSADTVRALAGTYAESLSITKALALQGAGKGSTIIDPAGSSATGILVSGNIGSGAAVAIRDLTVQGGGIGIKVSDAATTLGTLTLDGLAVLDNASQGFISSNGGAASTAVAHINILNSVFAGNGVGPGSADINLFRFNGNALVKNVDIVGTRGSAGNLNAATDYGLQIRGQGDIGGTAAAGNVRLEDVRISGNYRRAHLGIQRYSDASGITMSGVSLAGNAGFGRFFSSDQGGALSLGNTMFLASAGELNPLDISIGAETNTLRVDATATTFFDADGNQRTDNFVIERRVQHAADSTTLGGVVTWRAGNVYVTNDRSIQRGVDIALAGETVNVQGGIYAEDVVVGQRRNLMFNDAQVGSLTITCAACGSGIGGSVKASGAAGFRFDAPVVLLADTVLDTSAANRPVSAVAMDGSGAGNQKLTVRAGGGAVSLGNLGATTRLGAVDVSGAIRFTGSAYFASSLLFAGPMMLDTPAATFRTNGGNIVLDGDLQSPGGGALALDAGAGDVTLVSGGSAGNPLGRLEVDANNFTLQGTLWVSGYDIDALGSVALSDHTLRSIGGGAGAIEAGGYVTGGVFSDGPVFIHSTSGVDITGAAPSLVVDAPSGNVDGDFGQVTNSGGGLIGVNGRPQLNTTLAASADNSRVVPAEVTTAASPQANGPQGGGKPRRRKPADALDALENGEALEVDLSPG